MIEIKNLSKTFEQGGNFFTNSKKIYAVSNVSLNIEPGNAVGLVGESGCGKSTFARCVLQLIKPTGGSVFFNGVDLTKINGNSLKKLRAKFQMVFQDPGESLNPRMKISEIIGEPLNLHTNFSTLEKRSRMEEIMNEVGLKTHHLERFPHQFSGGQQQRIGIARAIATKPNFIVLDEPTSALDVSIRGQILKLLQDLRSQFNLSYLLITHDLNVVLNVCDYVAVMYLGKIVEFGTTESIFNSPLHPYTQALLSSIPIPDPLSKNKRIKLKGEIPSPTKIHNICALHGRCPVKNSNCDSEYPLILEKKTGHFAACWNTNSIITN